MPRTASVSPSKPGRPRKSLVMQQLRPKLRENLYKCYTEFLWRYPPKVRGHLPHKVGIITYMSLISPTAPFAVPQILPSVPESAVAEAVRRDAVQTGLRMLNSILVAQLAAALVLYFIVRDVVPSGRVTIWAGYHVLMMALSLILGNLARKHAEHSIQTRVLGQWLSTFALLRSASWAIAAVLFFPYLDFPNRTVFLALMCALCIGATTTSIAYFPAFVAFVIGALVPTAIMFAIEPEPRSRAIGIGLFVGWLLVLRTGYRLHQWLEEASRRKFELELTTAALWEERARTESALANAEKAGRESEALRLTAERASLDKTRFLASASHDLRQPMHSLVLFLEAARGRNKDRDVDGLLQKVDQSVQSLDALFESLLDISRLDSATVAPRKSRFALAPLLSEIETRFAGVAAEKRISLRVRGSEVWVLSDAALLERIISNLVSNAIRYTQRGGVLVGVRSAGAKVRIEVWDTGIGIPEDKHEEVFQEFVQLDNPERDRRKGLGLGLAIVQRLSLLLDHPIIVRSAPNRGTTMSVVVPAVRPPAPTTAPAPMRIDEVGLDALSRISVLLVDDEVAALDATMTALEAMGCEVYPAASDRDALSTATAQMRSDRPLRVIVSDFRLGNSERTGLELIEALRIQAGQRTPAVLLTGDVAMFNSVGAKVEIPSDIVLLSKPASSAQLSQAIRKLIVP
jgi:two-component system, sensor histidine kinase